MSQVLESVTVTTHCTALILCCGPPESHVMFCTSVSNITLFITPKKLDMDLASLRRPWILAPPQLGHGEGGLGEDHWDTATDRAARAVTSDNKYFKHQLHQTQHHRSRTGRLHLRKLQEIRNWIDMTFIYQSDIHMTLVIKIQGFFIKLCPNKNILMWLNWQNSD